MSVSRRPPVDKARRAWGLATLAAVVASLAMAGLDPTELVNTRGWGQVSRFLTASVRPDLSPDLLWITVRESGVTLAYALVGTALSLVIGLVGGLLLTEKVWTQLDGSLGHGRWVWGALRLLAAGPRSIHEVVFGLLLVFVLGLNPLVAVLAIGLPFGAVTAKVFAELLDDAPESATATLRAQGFSPFAAVVFGALPQAMGDILSYAFYRLECGIRSAAVLGIVGAGGLGFQLALSFQSLAYNEMWTFLWALILISGLADRWSSLVRRGSTPTRSLWVALAALPFAWWGLHIDLSTLWSRRARTLGSELLADALPPKLPRGGWSELLGDTADTLALSILSILMAWIAGSVFAFMSARRTSDGLGAGSALSVAVGIVTRFFLLVARAVPPPVWALIVVFVLFPGLWPGAVALAIYNAGVLGRLQAEVVENHNPSAANTLRATGATPMSASIMATVPIVSPRFVALGLYRWEVGVRETVMVGVVGAGGLGRALDEQVSAFAYPRITTTILALMVATIVVDFSSSSIRRTIR